MERTRLKPISKKQKEKNTLWKQVTDQRCRDLNYICQWCGLAGSRVLDDDWAHLDGHHIIPRRFNIHTPENCYICHRLCHDFIGGDNPEHKPIDVTIYKTKQEWEAMRREYEFWHR